MNGKNNEVVLDTSALAAEEWKPGLNAGPSAFAESPLAERREHERRKSKQPGPSPGQVLSHPLITVLIASAREGLLKELLPWLASEQDIKVLGKPVADPVLLSICLERWQPTLLLLDKALLDRLGPESLRMFLPKVRKVRVLLLWDEVCPGLVENILRNRFHGHLLIRGASDTYVKAIRTVCRGDIWLPRSLLAQALSDLLQTPRHDDAKAKSNRVRSRSADMLTKREEQIVELLSQGITNKQIARQLGIMEDTVKKHMQHVFGKLGVHRRTLVVLRRLAGQPASA